MDIYSDSLPEGVTMVGIADQSDLSYEFHQFMVLEKDGVYYWASDSGCSCPTPFDYHDFPQDFESGNSIHALNALTKWSEGIPVEDDGLRTKLMNAPIVIKEAA